jgi:hypothetical protein
MTNLPGQALILPPAICHHFSRGIAECQRLLQNIHREEFIMPENDEMVTMLQTASSVTSEITTLERNPAADFFPAVNGLVK